MRKIFLKELRSYFDSTLAYIFIVIFLLLGGAYLASNVFLANVASMQTFFEVAPVLLMLFVPAITMRLVAEEKRVGTFEILQTKPLSTARIIVGKFLAAWFVVCCALLPTFFYVLIIQSLGSLDSGAITGGYIGLVMLGGVFAAAGVFGSSITSNQIVALIFSFVIGFVLFAFDRILMYVPLHLVSTVEYLGVGHHFSGLSRGVLDTRNLVYYGTLIVFFVTTAAVGASQEPGQSLWRWRDFNLGHRFAKVAVFIGILVFINLISMRTFVRVDLTDDKVYTLSDVTRTMLGTLDDNFLVRAYFSPDLPPPYHNHRKSVRELMEEFRAYSGGKFHYQFVNPFAGPQIEREAQESGITPVQLKVIRNNRFQNARAYAGLAFSYADKQEHLPVVSSLERLECDITGSLKKLTADRLKTIAIATGLGGPGVMQMRNFVAALSRQHEVVTVDISAHTPVPQNVHTLLVIAPDRRLREAEKVIIDQYIMNGGRVAFFVNAVAPDRTNRRARATELNLDDMFDTYGWVVNKDVVGDVRSAPFTLVEKAGDNTAVTEVLYPLFPVAAEYMQGTNIVRMNAPVAFSLSSSIDTRLAGVRGVAVQVVAMTSQRSGRFPVDSVSIDPVLPLPPSALTDAHIPLAATFEGSFRSVYADSRDPAVREAVAATGIQMVARSPKTRLAVVGDGDFLLDDRAHGYDNSAFGVSLVDWLVADTVLATIRAREITPRPLSEVSEETKTLVKYLSFAGPPGIVVVAGLVWTGWKKIRRRRHKSSF